MLGLLLSQQASLVTDCHPWTSSCLSLKLKLFVIFNKGQELLDT